MTSPSTTDELPGESRAGGRWKRLARNPLFTTVLLLVAILLMRLPFAWTGNEENYFLLAHRMVDPGAYGPFDPVFDSSRGRWLGLVTLGSAVSLFGFEAAHKLIGVIGFMLTATGLAALARLLRLGALQVLATLLVFVALGQSIVGGEWFIGGVETKAFAYGFGMLALAAAGHGRSIPAAALTALSACFHFQVGAFWLICVVLFLANKGGGWAARVRVFGGWSLLFLAPLIIALVLDGIDAAAAVRPPGSPSADTIYSVLRAPRHMAPFAQHGGWAESALLGAALGLVMAPAARFLASRQHGALRALLLTIALLALLLPLAVLLSWLDREHATLGKFYLFRPASPLLLLTLLSGCAVASRFLDRPVRLRPVLRLLSLFLSLFLWPAIIIAGTVYLSVFKPPFPPPPKASDTAAVVAAVRSNTRPDQLVLIDPELDTNDDSFARQLGRPTFVSWKFVPTNPADIYRWYDRIELRRKLFQNDCPASPRIGALVMSARTLETKAGCGRLVYRDEHLGVVALNGLAPITR